MSKGPKGIHNASLVPNARSLSSVNSYEPLTELSLTEEPTILVSYRFVGGHCPRGVLMHRRSESNHFATPWVTSRFAVDSERYSSGGSSKSLDYVTNSNDTWFDFLSGGKTHRLSLCRFAAMSIWEPQGRLLIRFRIADLFR